METQWHRCLTSTTFAGSVDYSCRFTTEAKNAPFPPLAEMPIAQPCQGVAEKVSLLLFAYCVFEGTDQSRHTLHAN